MKHGVEHQPRDAENTNAGAKKPARHALLDAVAEGEQEVEVAEQVGAHPACTNSALTAGDSRDAPEPYRDAPRPRRAGRRALAHEHRDQRERERPGDEWQALAPDADDDRQAQARGTRERAAGRRRASTPRPSAAISRAIDARSSGEKALERRLPPQLQRRRRASVSSVPRGQSQPATTDTGKARRRACPASTARAARGTRARKRPRRPSRRASVRRQPPKAVGARATTSASVRQPPRSAGRRPPHRAARRRTGRRAALSSSAYRAAAGCPSARPRRAPRPLSAADGRAPVGRSSTTADGGPGDRGRRRPSSSAAIASRRSGRRAADDVIADRPRVTRPRIAARTRERRAPAGSSGSSRQRAAWIHCAHASRVRPDPIPDRRAAREPRPRDRGSDTRAPSTSARCRRNGRPAQDHRHQLEHVRRRRILGEQQVRPRQSARI